MKIFVRMNNQVEKFGQPDVPISGGVGSGRGIQLIKRWPVVLLVAAFALLGAETGLEAAITSAATGPWSATATWVGNVVPGTLDVVNIAAGHTVTVDIDTNCASISIAAASAVNGLAISSGKTLTTGALTTLVPGANSRHTTIAVGAGTLTASSIALAGIATATRYTELTISSGTVNVTGAITSKGVQSMVTFTGAGTINVGGTFLSSAATGAFTPFAGSTVNYNGGAAQTVSAFTYANLTLSGSAAKTMTSVTTVNGDLTLSGSATMTGNGALAIGGNLSYGSSGSSILGGNISIAGDLTVSAGSLDVATYTVDRTTSGGTLTVGAGASLLIGGTAYFPVNYSAVTLNAASTVNYNKAGDQTVSVQSYGHLTLSGSGVKTMTSITTIGGDLTLSGSVTMTGFSTSTIGGSLNYGSSGSFSLGNNLSIAGNLTVSAGTLDLSTYTANRASLGGTLTLGPAASLLVGGAANFPVNYSAVTLNASSTVNYTGAGQTVSAQTYGHLTLSGSGTKTLGGLVVLGGNLTIGSGTTLDTAASNYAVQLGGDFVNDGTFNANSSTITISGTAAQSIAGFTTLGDVVMTKTGGTATFQGNVNGIGLTLNGSGGTLDLGAGLTHTFSGTWTRSNGTLLGNTSTLKIGGSVSGAIGTFTANTGAVEWNGGSQTIAGLAYNNLTLSGSGTKTAGGNLTILGNLNIPSGIEFSIGSAYTLGVTGTTTVSGTNTLLSTGSKTFTGNVTISSGGVWNETGVSAYSFGGNLQNDGTLTANTGVHTFSGASMTFSGSHELAIPKVTVSGTYSNNGLLTVSTTLAGAGTLTQCANSTLNIGGTSTTFTLDASGSGNTVNYTGAGQTVKPTTYANLTLSGSAAKTMTSVTTVNGDLTLSGSATMTGNGALAIGGSLNYGTSGSSTLGGNLSIAGDLTVSAGALDVATYTVDRTTSGGTLTVGAGASLLIGGTAYFPVNYSAVTLNAASTVGFNKAGDQTVSVQSYGNLTLSGSGAKTMSSVTTVNGNLNVLGSATLTSAGPLMIGGALNYQSSGATTLAGNVIAGGALTINGSGGTLNLGTSLTHTFSGALALTVGTLNGGSSTLKIGGDGSMGGTFTANTGTVEWNGGSQTIVGMVYNNLTLSGSGVKTAGGSLTIAGSLNIPSGIEFSIGSTYTLGVTGTTTVSGTNTLLSIGAKTFTGNVTISSGGVWNETGVSTYSFGGNLQNDGMLTANTGVHTFSGASMTFSGSHELAIPKVTVSGTYRNDGTLTVSTTLAGAGTLTQGANSTLNIGGTSLTFTLDASGSGNTVNYTGVAQTVKSVSYYHLTLSGTGAKTLTGVTVNGVLSMEGTATASVAPTYGAAATLQYNTATARTAGATEWITPFAASGGVLITNTGAITLNAAKVLNDSVPLTIRSGATLDTDPANSRALTLGGNFINNGTFTANGSAITNNGSGAQSIAGFTTTGPVAITKTAGTATFAGAVSGGALTITGAGGSKLDLGAVTTHSFASLSLGGLGRINGTWGSSSSGAVYQNNTYFSASTGYLTVNLDTRTTPSVTNWPTANGITYLQALSDSSLNTGAAGVTNTLGAPVAGTFTFTTPATTPNAGTYSASVTFTPTDTAAYTPVNGNVNVAVAKADPHVSTIPTASTITYGQMLSASALGGGAATNALGGTVSGSFAFTTPATMPNFGTAAQSVTFTPSDTVNYNTVSTTVNVTVNSRAVSLTGSRPYDGTAVAAFGILRVANKVGSDTVLVASGSGTLASATDGAWAAITALGDLALGNNALGNYTLTGASGSVAIGAAPAATNIYHVVPVNPAASSPYDTWDNAATDIQTAVNKAAADLIPGTVECVVLVSNGTYSLTSQILITNGITLRGVNGRDVTFINGNYPAYTNRCIKIQDNATRVTVDGFTIANGYNQILASAGVTNPAGGGVYVTNGIVSLVNCTISRNRSENHGCGIGLSAVTGAVITNCIISLNTNAFTAAGYGGGVYLFQSKGRMVDCSIVSNGLITSGSALGGGLYLDSSGLSSADFVVSNCAIAYNYARSGGGGVYLTGQATVTRCTINNNTTLASAGGVQMYDAQALVTYSTIASNRAGSAGGGVQFNQGGVMYNCWIIGNYAAGVGGGISKAVGSVRSCLIAGNQSGGNGGGVNFSGGDMANCTIVRNYSSATGGLYIAIANALITNVIVYFNQAAVTNDAGPFTSINYSCAPELTTGSSGNITNDPLFVDAGSGYGTNAVLGNCQLLSGSPCIDAGTNLTWMTNNPTVDLAGNARIYPTLGRVDMGAYETVVGRSAPLIATWPTASGITYLQALSNSVLSGGLATNAAGDTVLGNFAFTAPGTNPVVGTFNAAVTFTPTDTANYLTANGNVNVAVAKAAPRWSASPTASGVTYLQALSNSVLSGGSATNASGASVPGSFAFTTPGTTPGAGAYSAAVTFTPTDTANYMTANGNVNVAVAKAAPGWSASPTASGITYLQALSNSVLSGGSAINASGAFVPGSFAFTTPGTTPNPGTYSAPVTFTPTDTANYMTANGNVNVAVAKADPHVSTIPSASTITYGQMLSASALSGGAVTNSLGVSVPGSFAFTTPATTPNSGAASQSVTFTPSDTVNYNTVSTTVNVTVNSRAVSLTGSRPYDGTAVAASGILRVANKVGSDTVLMASGSGILASATDGAWAAITSLGDLALGNNALGNYTLTGASGSVAIGAVPAATNTYHVVPVNPLAAPPYDTWANAATDIQTAVNKAAVDLIPGTVECVVLVSNGTYSLTSQILITNGITLRGVNGRDVTFINGNYPAYTNRCIKIQDNATRATVDGFTITNGYNTLVSGGGVFVTNGAVSLVNCTISRNRSDTHGGGIGVMAGSNVVITNCVISLNSNALAAANSYGGGVYLNQSKGAMTECTIVSNGQGVSASSYGGGLYIVGGPATDFVVSNCTMAYNYAYQVGGGAYLASGGTITRCIINNNISRQGSGGVQLNSATTLMTYSTIASNVAGTLGGGIQFGNSGGMYNCRIIGNYGGNSGGGVYLNAGSMRNCLVAGNQTAANGGGVYGTASGGDMINCTIVGNYAVGSGGGCFATGSGIGAPLTNVIVYGNQAAISTNDAGAFTNFSYSCAPELTAGVNSNLTNNPMFINAGSGYGTNAVLGDYTLQTNSPCIGAGYNASWMTVDPKVDLAGNNRIRPAWGTVDMGAYEAPPSLLGALTNSFTGSPVVGVSPLPVVFSGETSGSTNGLVWQWIFGDGTTNDWSVNGVVTNTYAARGAAYTVILNVTNAGGEWMSKTNLNYIQVYPVMAYVATNGMHVSPFETWGNAATNIQAAVDVAGAGYTVAVLVSNGVYTVTTATNGITVNKGITLRGFSGNWADTTIKGGFPASTNRCLTISGGGAVVDGFTITNGNLGANSLAGGGVNMSAGTVQNCLIIGNVANGISQSGGNGAGLYSSGGNVFSCTIKKNVSTLQDGGGIFSAGVVSNCLIIGNSTPGRGGGFRMSGVAIMDRCVISNNTAASNGGGIYKSNTGIGTIRNTLVAGNQAQALGGGLYCDTIPVSLENCTMVGNLATNGGGVYAVIAGLAATNCIIINNLGSAAGGTNELGGIAGNFAYSCSSNLVNGENNNINANPMFVRAGSGYGTNWIAGDYRLMAGSPCIDTGTNLSWMASTLDLAGDARIQGIGPNMGAYETPYGTIRGSVYSIR